MKRLLFLIAAVTLLILSSCEKDKLESPGNIQGMGNTPGELQVKEPFTLPDGIHIIGDITGIENPILKSGEMKSSFVSKAGVFCYGSGRYVRLKVTLLNSRSNPRTVFFPKGLVWKCNFGGFQNGLQGQTTWVCLAPNESRYVYIDLYCINEGYGIPDQTGKYSVLGITSSRVLWDLLNLVGWRKINFEMIYNNYLAGKSDGDGPSYEAIVERLQTIVWNLTDNGVGISEDDIAFIESIPELATEQIPQVDENSQFPEYFEEFEISGK